MNLPINKKNTIIVLSVAAFSVTIAAVLFVVFYLTQKKNMKISAKGLSIIKEAEGLRLNAYKCQAGVLTIGYGHTKGVKEGDTCTKEQAEQYLIEDIADAESTVNWQGLNINQNQFDALVSFVYNLGAAAFKKSTLLKKIKENPKDPTIAAEFAKYKFAGGVVSNGLVTRRSDESNLYFA